MAKRVRAILKLQLQAGQATPAPPVGPALGQHGLNIMQFIKEYNARTAGDSGTVIPAEITVFEDRSFTFITKTPPTSTLILEAVGEKKGSGEPNRENIGSITKVQVKKIAEVKMPDLNAAGIESAMSMVSGTARSMGVLVEG